MGMLPPPKCPRCKAELKLGASGKLDAWTCPNGHGVGFTISEAYERLQEDEIQGIWEAAKTASEGKHICPMCDRRMVEVTIGVDPDEAAGGEAGDQPDTSQVTLEVCREDQFIWFDPGELEQMPEDLPDPEPSAAELAKLEQIRKSYAKDLDELYADHGLLDRFATHVQRHHPGFVRFLDRVVYRGEADELDAA
jgi:Zn-finger nucleic acid-binding protein